MDKQQINFESRLNSLASMMFEIPNQNLNRAKKIQTTDEAFNCIHLEPVRFIRLLNGVRAALDYLGKLKFIDVGCGLGQKVCLAQMEHFQATGLELREPYVKKAKQLMAQFFTDTWYVDGVKPVPQILQGDAIKFTGYKNFDVVYFYRPAPSHEIQGKIETAIATRAKTGAVVIGVFSESFYKQEFRNKHGWEQLKDKSGQAMQDCYIKVKGKTK